MTYERAGFRLAFRAEGKWWNAYLAEGKTMEGSTLLGSVLMTMVSKPETRDCWKAAMTELFRHAIKDSTDLDPTMIEEKAPEHERSGAA